MFFYYYLLLFVIICIIALLIRFFVLRKNSLPVELYSKALRDENSGQFEAALIAYRNALEAADKSRFSGKLKIKIEEKLKVMHTVIEYHRGTDFVR